MCWIVNRKPSQEEILKDKGHFICTYRVCGRVYVGELYYDMLKKQWFDLWHIKREVIAWRNMPNKYKEK